jgi:hypothetical protein
MQEKIGYWNKNTMKNLSTKARKSLSVKIYTGLNKKFGLWITFLKIWSLCWTQSSEWSLLRSSISLVATLNQAKWHISQTPFSFVYSSTQVSWSCFAMPTCKVKALAFSMEMIQISMLIGSQVKERLSWDQWSLIFGSHSWWK